MRLTHDDERARRICSLALDFMNARSPLPTSAIAHAHYPDLREDAFRKAFSRDRAMLERAPLMDEVAKSVSRGLGLRWRQPGARIATCQARLRNRLLRHLDDMRMRAVDMLAA